MGKISVLKPGFYSSVQDLGRFGYAHLGIPAAGAMDQSSFLLANYLLRNPSHAACVEMTLRGAMFHFDEDTEILLCGAQANIMINGIFKQRNTVLPIRAGEVLEIGNFTAGQRMYLSVRGGINSASELGSRSFYKGITPSSRLKEGDQLEYKGQSYTWPPPHARVKPRVWNRESGLLEVYPGPELTILEVATTDRLFQTEFTVSALQDRMGVQLAELLPHHHREILTSPVYPGTVQLTAGGKLIILMRDAQVTGGYPRVLQLTEESVSLLSQKRPGQKVRFSLLEGI